MENLAKAKCEACDAGASLVTEAEIKELQPQIPDWKIIEENNIRRLQRIFKFSDFMDALGFTNRVGALAEKNDHHPAILTEYGKVTVTWCSHKIKGLHKNDFIMAAKTDQLLQ